MAEKYKNKYRIESCRLQNWNYGWNGQYFITICTKNREHYFGEIIEGKMQLSNIGVIANILWYEIKNHAKKIKIDEFVVMPNHIHGIITIENDDLMDNVVVETRHALSLQQPQPQSQSIGQQRFQNQGKNTISSIIGGYKSAVTKHVNRLGYIFAWQPKFYDHIIRDDDSLHRIKKYILDNPKKWKNDNFYCG
ncbi:MAG: transposase [Bacteroidales bacterium]|nr:transposase [Bacteroidales bacterium]